MRPLRAWIKADKGLQEKRTAAANAFIGARSNKVAVEHAEREDADKEEKTEEIDYRGLYRTAKHICEATAEWEEKVSPWLDGSKFLRSLTLPFFMLGLWLLVSPSDSPFEARWTGAIWNCGTAFLACLLALCGMVYLRKRHIVVLYEQFVGSSDEDPSIRITRTKRGRVRFSIAARGELPFLKIAPSSKSTTTVDVDLR